MSVKWKDSTESIEQLRIERMLHTMEVR